MLFDEIIFIVKSIIIEGHKLRLHNKEVSYRMNWCRHYYELYLLIEQIEYGMSLVLKHYFPLSLETDFLQNSQFGKPIDKWRYFTNQDFNHLNQNVLEFIKKVSLIGGNIHIMAPIIKEAYLIDFFDPKSQWTTTFIQSYSSGQITKDNV